MPNPTLSAGMSATNQPVAPGIELDVLSGGLSINTSIAGTEVLLGGTDSSGTVLFGGMQVVSAGGKALSGLVNAGGTQTISSGGLASGNTVTGIETVLPGGTSISTVLLSGTGVFGVPLQTVSGVASGTVVVDGELVVATGGAAVSATISASGLETISAGGSATDGALSFNGSETVYGTDSDSLTAGSEAVEAGGTVVGGVLAASGIQTVMTDGLVTGEMVSGMLVLSGGSASFVTVEDGGALMVAAGGSTVGTMLASGPPGGVTETLLAGATATGTVIGAGAQLFLSSGGSVSDTSVGLGGLQSISDGATALDDSVLAGGMVADNGALVFDEASGPVASTGGALSGSGTVVQDGDGTLLLTGSLANFTGSTVINAGTLELGSGFVGDGAPIVFAGGTLVVNGDAPPEVISGFSAGSAIDLTGLPYAAGVYTVATTSGTATLMSGGQPVKFSDASTATLNISGADTLLLATESDGNGGTLLAALGQTGASPYGDVLSAITVYNDGAWGFTEPAGISATFLDGSTNVSDVNVYPPVFRPLGSLIEMGPGTLVLPTTELQSVFDGTVLIDGGVVEITEPAGDGVTSFSFVSGSTGTLQIDGITEQPMLSSQVPLGPDGSRGVTYVAISALTPISAIFPGDVIDLRFLPYTSALSLSVTTSGVTVTSGGSAIVVPNTTPVATSGTTLTQPIAAADSLLYSLTSDGAGGTDLAVVGTRGSGAASPTSGTVSDGGVEGTITTYADGTLVFEEPAGESLAYAEALPASGVIVQSGPGGLNLAATSDATIIIAGGTLDLDDFEETPFGSTAPVQYGAGPIEFASAATGTLLVNGDVLPSLGLELPPETISGFQAGDVISGFLNLSEQSLGIAVSGNTVALTENGQILGPASILHIDSASVLPLQFSSAPDGSSFTLSVACYTRDTLILTDAGERPVQELAIGDRVVTVSGKEEPIRWIGRRSYGGRFLTARRAALAPILIRAGALGGGLPRRDLRVSPTHAMLLDGLLVPARCLMNHADIVQDLGCTEVNYFHIELAQHDAIWAEGAASETFIDDDSRGLFHNAAEYRTLYPDATERSAAMIAPRVDNSYRLEAIRARLACRA